MKKSGLLFFITEIIILVFLAGCNNNGGNTLSVSNSLRREAIQVIRLNLENQSKWEKVHAAEYLLWLGYPQGVKEAFLKEERKFGTESPYRIGIWRVLAQADTASEKKRIWVDKILSAYQDSNSTDRVHAAETLAKLHISPLKESPEITKKILEGEISPLSIYTLWGVAASATDTVKNYKSTFLNILANDSVEIQLKSIAAYALGHLDNLNPKEWHNLAQSALASSGKQGDRTNLLSAAFVTAPDDSTQSISYLNIRRNLLETKSSPTDEANRLEMTAALAERGALEDLPLLASLMDNGSTYLQAAAAYAILKIDRRVEHGLAWLDWGVIAAYLLSMFGIGFYYYRKNKNENDFFLGSGKMNPIAVGLSLFATFTSAISYLASSGEMIKHGPVFFTGILAFPLIYYVGGWFIIPRLKRFNVISGYEILEIKLGISIRMLATFLFLSLRFLWMATMMYVTVFIVLLPIFKIDPSYSLIISAVLMIVTIIYTSIGGLKAVVVTDAIQAIILLGGALIVILVVSVHFGSFTSWLPDHWLSQWGKLDFGVNARDRSSIGAVVLMTFLWYVASTASDQMSIQRFLATKDVKSARKTFGISLWANIIGTVLLSLVGLALLAYFTANPQYLSAGNDLNTQADLLFPRFIVVGFPPGLSGLLVAAVLAATMSSLSSGINSCASVITEDIVKRFRPKEKKLTNELKQVQMLSLLVGVITLLLSFAIPYYVKGNLIDIAMKVVNLRVSVVRTVFPCSFCSFRNFERNLYWRYCKCSDCCCNCFL